MIRVVPSVTSNLMVDVIESSFFDLEKDFGIQGFFEKLKDDDDWSLVINLHALLESMFIQLLADALNRRELTKPFTPLPMHSKLKFLGTLGLVTKRSVDYVEALSEIRNRAAHNVARVHDSVGDLIGHEPDNLIKKLSGESSEKYLKRFHADPRQAVLHGALHVLKHLDSVRMNLPKQQPAS
jgi:hypothetical protein